MAQRLKSPAPLDRFKVTITYLEQTARPGAALLPRPTIPTALLRAVQPSPDFYRYLFDAVGGPHRWVSRRYLDDAALTALIHSPMSEIYVLYAEGWPAGYAELSLEKPEQVEIKFFGLVPERQGQRLGPWFFQQVLDLAWDKRRPRVIIETCTADNPAALRLYQRMGFQPYDQGQGVIEWYG